MLSLAFASALVASSALYCPSYAAVTLDTPPPKADEVLSGQSQDAPSPEQVCAVSGMVYCTEYGTRFKEPLTLVAEGGRPGEAATAVISMDDGTFNIALPCGGSYRLRIEFAGKGFDMGELTTPAAEGGCGGLSLSVHWPGSMLELVRDARRGVGADAVSFKLVGGR